MDRPIRNSDQRRPGGVSRVVVPEVADPSLVCTLIAIHRRVHGAPLVVAANRDEYYDRPAEPPALRTLAGCGAEGRDRDRGGAQVGWGPIVAPLDLRAGGTWLGVNAQGVFAAVTNLPSESRDPTRRSRGMVVMEALRQSSAARGADFLKTLSEETYNPFNCFVADRERAFRLTYRDFPRVTELRAGVHVIGNADPEAGPAPKTERVKAAVEAIVPAESGGNGKSGESDETRDGGDSESGARDAVLEGLAAVCREHLTEERGISDTCVHLDLYGTRSSLLLWMDDERRASRLLYADGPPCEVEYEDFSPLLYEQSQRASYRSGETAARTGS